MKNIRDRVAVILVIGVLTISCVSPADFTPEQYSRRLSEVVSLPIFSPSDPICHPVLNQDGSVTTDWCFDGDETSKSDSAAARPPIDGDDFSILAWSCVEPFAYQKGASRPSVRARRSLAMHMMALRAEGRVQIEDFPDTPSFGLGLGDQVYVDPEPKDPGQGGAILAAFGGNQSDKWYVAKEPKEPKEADAFFDSAYEAYLLNGPMDRVLKNVPTMMLWDDHEIRDGWGSHGDEHGDEWKAWFTAAGQHYVNWQIKRGPQVNNGPVANWKTSNSDPDTCTAYSQQLEVGTLRMFGMDTRACRKTRKGVKNESHILGFNQRDKFFEWIDEGGECTPGRIWAVASSVPLFVTDSSSLRLNLFRAIGSYFKGNELDDDLYDSWGHRDHRWEQEKIIHALQARLETCMAEDSPEYLLVMSGDIHQSGLIGITFKGRNVGYEVISSGVAADVDGVDGFTWLGLDPYKNQKSEDGDYLTGHWLGTLGTTPSFAEINFPQSDGKDREIQVAWFLTAALDSDYLANTEPFEGLVCQASDMVELDAVHSRLLVPGTRTIPTSQSVLVDRLEFGVTAEVMLESKATKKFPNRVITNLHRSAVFTTHSSAKHDLPLDNLSGEALCSALGY